MQELRNRRFEFINLVRSKSREALNLIHSHKLNAGDFKYAGGVYNFFRKASKISHVKEFDEAAIGKRPRGDYQNAANWPGKTASAAALIVGLANDKLIALLNDILGYWDKNYTIAHSAETVLNNFYAFGLIADISRKLKEYKDENNLMLLADAPKF